MKEWFNSNFLLLNFYTTYYTQFTTKNKFLSKINFEHDNKMILQTNFVKFLDITVVNTLSWKQHIDTVTPKLNKACYIIRRSEFYLLKNALKIVYYAFFSLSNVLWFDFWGNSTKSRCVFK